jgi:cyanuric acid amidohydrolase
LSAPAGEPQSRAADHTSPQSGLQQFDESGCRNRQDPSAPACKNVARALGEIDVEIDEDRVLKDWDLFSSVASSSAGIELMHNVVIVMGNSRSSMSPFVIGHAVMRDSIDLSAVIEALKSVGLGLADAQSKDRLVNIFAKAEASPDGCVRGFRHTMLDDSDVGSTRHARAAVGGLISGLSGTGAVYVSGGAEHQGPPGGGPVAVIARV